MEPIIIKLKVPIIFGSETISELKFRPAKAKDFRDCPLEPKTGDLINIAAKLSAQPPSVLDELSTQDFVEVMSTVGKLMDSGHLHGASSLVS